MAAPLTDTQKQTFLDALAKCGVISDALQAAGIKSRQTIKNLCESDKQFSDAYDEAVETSRDTLESEARRRAVEGVVSKRYDKDGNLIAETMNYSDSLLQVLLKGERSDKFADRTKAEISNPDGSLKPVEGDMAAAARIAALLDAAAKRKGSTDDAEDLLS